MEKFFKTCWVLSTLLFLIVACSQPPAATNPPIATFTPHPVLARLAPKLQGLGLDSFLFESYRALLLRDPETVTELGLAGMLGMKEDQLTNLSEDYVLETLDLAGAILDILKTYDPAAMTPEQKVSVDIYAWYLDDLVRSRPFLLDNYLVGPGVFGVNGYEIYFFRDVMSVNSKEDAQNYIARLGQVKAKFKQVIDGLERRKKAGVILPKFIIPTVINNLGAIANSAARQTSIYEAFEHKVGTLSLPDVEEQALLSDAEKAINESLIPAYRDLVKYMIGLQSIATNDAGVWKFPNGYDYYAYILRHHTSTEMTADQIHALGLQEVERLRKEIRAEFDTLGYPKEEAFSELFDRVAKEGGYLSDADIAKGYEAILDAADQKLETVFDLRPKAKLIIIRDPVGGFYEPPAIDGSRPGAFYANTTGTIPKFGMAVLAYHEGIPGHHYQIALAQELNIPLFQKAGGFTAYVEGWGLYAEQLTWEMGLYQDDPYGNLGRLQLELIRAMRLVVDTGIHAKKWTYDQAVTYMMDNGGLSKGWAQSEISRYTVNPGQATAYKIGMLKILDLRQEAKDQLGTRFDIKQFHNAVLGHGQLPLEVLEQVVQDYITKTN